MYGVVQSGVGWLMENGDVTIGREEAAAFDTWLDAAVFAYDQYVGHGYLDEKGFERSMKNGWIFIESI